MSPGEEVRYGGGHTRDAPVTDTLGFYVSALRAIALATKHVNVLQHLVGFFRDRLTDPEKRGRLGPVGDCAKGLGPLVVPITLVNHDVARFLAYVRDQVDLRPHPKELMLRHRV